MISTGRYSKSYFTEQVLKMESSGLRLAISWAHPQGNTDSLWGRLKVCETMKKKDTNIQTNTIEQTQNTQHTNNDNYTKHTWAPPLPPQGDTHSLWRKLEVCQCTMSNQRHIFKILFYFFASKLKKRNRFSAKAFRQGATLSAGGLCLGWRNSGLLPFQWLTYNEVNQP